MKCIVLFGAGKSATVLIDYLKTISRQNNWQVFVGDASFDVASQKTGAHPHVTPVGLDVYDDEQRSALIQKADVVISLLPPMLHILVAKDCVRLSRHLLTASYIDERIKALENDIKAKGILFLCEMGLDPGIDHMSAMKMIHRIEGKGGSITSFVSHCGGLVAPESDDNPWHYKISWNPRNVVMAGKSGAAFKEDDIAVFIDYPDLFADNKTVVIPGLGEYAFYPNRDSLQYQNLYGLSSARTFIRTTLRHSHFCSGWKKMIEAGLTNETSFYDTDGLSIAEFFYDHLSRHNIKIEEKNGDDLFVQQLRFLGLHDTTSINKGTCSAADVLQFILEKKLPLQPHDKDMIVMLHEVVYKQKDDLKKETSCLVIKGENNQQTAMAKTVGMPLGIAATLLLQNKLNETGLQIPIIPSIYEPVMNELAAWEIRFQEL